ncbi:hypothetical protein Bbelb_214770 [Branchiostoma belcheri]|nr:hypothetical protein Bbelb_214770 [Branchiostoma belcheri]
MLPATSHDGNRRIVVTTTSDPIVRSFSGGSEEDFPPSKVNRRRRRKWEYEPIRRSTLPGQCSQADGSTERRVQTRSIAPLGTCASYPFFAGHKLGRRLINRTTS